MCIKRAAALLSFGTRNRPKERSNVGGGNPNVELLVTIIGSVHPIQSGLKTLKIGGSMVPKIFWFFCLVSLILQALLSAQLVCM